MTGESINTKKTHRALVLPGAVAKGAYEAGVIEVLAEKNIQVDRIVATSSGALNGIAYAAGIRSGHPQKMAERLVNSWIEDGGWTQSLEFSPLGLLSGRGLSNRGGLLKMLRSVIHPCSHSEKRDVELRIIVAPLNGVHGSIGERPATSFEKVIHFGGEYFDTQEGLEQVFDATTAACAFPGLFTPVDLPGLGPCVDGGTVNNAPIKYALSENDVDQILMPVPFPEVIPEEPIQHGIRLANHMIDILINERLYRDLKDAETVNNDLRKLEKLVTKGILTESQAEAVKKAFEIRPVKITEIRPVDALGGNPFSGFFNKKERLRLVNEGRRAAQAVKDSL